MEGIIIVEMTIYERVVKKRKKIGIVSKLTPGKFNVASHHHLISFN